MAFVFLGSQLRRRLPSDSPSRVCPCLELVVGVKNTSTVVLPQGTFTP